MSAIHRINFDFAKWAMRFGPFQMAMVLTVKVQAW